MRSRSARLHAMTSPAAPHTPPTIVSRARRRWLTLGATLAGQGLSGWHPSALAATQASGSPAHPGLPDPRPLQLGGPSANWRDHGSHPDWGTEWWYITGRLNLGPAPTEPSRRSGHALPDPAAPQYGFQLTFFRSRVAQVPPPAASHASQVPDTQAAPDRAPPQAGLRATHIISAHLAISDVRQQRLVHEQRVGRATAQADLGMGDAAVGDLQVRLGNWRLSHATDDSGQHLLARLPGQDLGLDLRCTPTQAPIVQGDGGLSRKGPDAQQISYYYSLPQLAVAGQLRLGAQNQRVHGTAWMDHEWSTALMHPDAVGWDWIGMNLNDGGALTAFRLRDAQGRHIWTGGSWRDAAGRLQVFGGDALRFEPLKTWRSTASKANYPTRWAIHTPVGKFMVQAAFDAQELDSRASTNAIYWEGLSALQNASGQTLGWGYLEMTGYAGRIKFS